LPLPPSRPPGAPGRPVVRPLQAPPRRPATPFVLPLATPLLVGLALGAIGLFWSKGPAVYTAATIGLVDAHDPWTWFRLVSGLFVHGRHHEFQALTVIFAVMYSGFRTERALGSGAMLLCFLVGGMTGDIVRLVAEAPELLKASAGTTTGALALLGATASASVRTRERPFLAAIVSGIGSALITTFFSCGQLQGISWDYFSAMLPAAGTAFLVGGMLGALLPLHDPSKRKGLRAGFLVAGLLVLGAGGAGYAGSLRALLHGASDVDPVGKRHPVNEEPDLVLSSDEHLSGYEFGIPIGHHTSRPDNPFPGVVLVPNIRQFPQIDIWKQRRDPMSSADGLASYQAKHLSEQYPDMKLVEEGPIDGCPLGPGYRVVVRVSIQEILLDFHICVVQAESDFLIVCVKADPEDLEAPAIAKAICRSLKLHAGPTDKKNGGR
jgi:hypothetical protein